MPRFVTPGHTRGRVWKERQYLRTVRREKTSGYLEEVTEDDIRGNDILTWVERSLVWRHVRH